MDGLASVGFPGTFGFVGTELLIDGAVQAYPRIGVITAAVAALNGIAVLRVYFLLFTGARRVTSVDLHIRPRERFAALTLVALILGAGLYPQPGVASRYRAALQILDERDALAASAGNRYGMRYTPPVQAPASSSAPRRLSGTGGMIHGAQLLGW